MRAIVKGKNVEVPDRVRQYADKKLARIERLLDDRSDATVEIWTEQHRSAADSHIVEITLVIDGQTLRAIDYKEKPRVRARPVEEKQILSRIADGTAESGRERAVVKTKRFAIEPMFEEDAIARMEELGHSFFLFVNAENERFNVLYMRRDGDFGIIEPVVGGEYTKGKSKEKASTKARAAG